MSGLRMVIHDLSHPVVRRSAKWLLGLYWGARILDSGLPRSYFRLVNPEA